MFKRIVGCLFFLLIITWVLISIGVAAFETLEPEARLKKNFILLAGEGATKRKSILEINDAIFSSQRSEKRIFHELYKHGAIAIQVINSSPAAQKEIAALALDLQPYSWRHEHIIALLDIIGLTHDSIYHIDGAVSQAALAIILQIMQPCNGGLTFTREAQSYLTYQLLQELDKYNLLKDPKMQMGVKYLNTGTYGIFTEGMLFPQKSTGQNELFSALLAEYAMREAGIPIQAQLIAVSAILNSIPFTSPDYNQYFTNSVYAVANRYNNSALPATFLSAVVSQVGNIFNNYFDITNYRDGSLLAAYNKVFTLEQYPELLRMFHSKQDDWLLVAAASLNNQFHQHILKPKLIKSELVVFHGAVQSANLNNVAIAAIEYEELFTKARAVGAFFAEVQGRHLDSATIIKHLLSSGGIKVEKNDVNQFQDQIVKDLESHANPLPALSPAYSLTQGYRSDMIAAKLIKQHGLVTILTIATELEHQIFKGHDLYSQKQLLIQLLNENAL